MLIPGRLFLQKSVLLALLRLTIALITAASLWIKLDSVVPLKNEIVDQRWCAPWYISQIRTLKQKVCRLKSKWHSCKIDTWYLTWKDCLVVYKKPLCKATMAYCCSLIEEKQNNPRLFFTTVAKLIELWCSWMNQSYDRMMGTESVWLGAFLFFPPLSPMVQSDSHTSSPSVHAPFTWVSQWKIKGGKKWVLSQQRSYWQLFFFSAPLIFSSLQSFSVLWKMFCIVRMFLCFFALQALELHCSLHFFLLYLGVA